MRLTKRPLKIKELHNKVIHNPINDCTNEEYFRETRVIKKLTDLEPELVCLRCFKKDKVYLKPNEQKEVVSERTTVDKFVKQFLNERKKLATSLNLVEKQVGRLR